MNFGRREMDVVQILMIVAAVIGTAYALARIYVALTPTPTDDKALAEVGILLKAAAKLFGLDLKQGRHMLQGQNKAPPKGPISIVLGFLLLAAVGCQSPRAQYMAAQRMYVGTVDVLVAANNAGKISTEDAAKITVLVHKAEETLNTWANDILMGEDSPETVDVVNGLLDELIQYVAKLEDD
jgi:hypothetical protein